MDHQTSFADLMGSGQKRVTRREAFLEQMDAVVPWDKWVVLIAPYYHSQATGRKIRGAEVMLRMYLLQVWFSLSDEGTEDSVADSLAMQRFMRLDLIDEQVPDATTLLKFRHMLEEHHLTEAMFRELSTILEESGVMMRGGSIVDATFIEAPSSTKNADRARDPEAHQAKKGNNWHFGYKAHTGVDAGSGLVHTVVVTSANVSDVTIARKLVRKDDLFCYADSGYTGVGKREEIVSDPRLSRVDWKIAKRPSRMKELRERNNWERYLESRKASVRSKVEHPYLIVKRQFGWAKTRYRGIAKNLSLMYVAFASANLAMCARAGRKLVTV
ncbi:MAG: IS5 family transposase [Atopobium sp.]|jgi:IS5 family transposase|nr:IS5 family transposase [Atopobium sp.]